MHLHALPVATWRNQKRCELGLKCTTYVHKRLNMTSVIDDTVQSGYATGA